MTNFNTNLHSRNNVAGVKRSQHKKSDFQRIVLESKMTDQNAEDDIEKVKKSVNEKTESDGCMNPNPSGTSESMYSIINDFTF